ncbi:MAG: ATP-binding domain-containing protein [Oscillatoriales cyanobacterium RU_3_3]|nr:ATP-binding domain-containing protein [Oscillatoriales cyanobacterium RU_3_3]
MPYFRDVPDIVEPVSPIADGPKPTLVEDSMLEIAFVVGQALKLARTQSVAILVPDRRYLNRITPQFNRGFNLDREIKTWKPQQGIQYYGTYHSAKGLEFDTVILPFCNDRVLPDPEAVKAFGETDAMAQAGRLLYVGVTRARTRLIITYSGEITKLLPTDPNLYEKVL